MSISNNSLKRVSKKASATLPKIPGKSINQPTSDTSMSFNHLALTNFDISEDIVLEESFIESVKKWGIIEPLIVREMKRGPFQTINGQKRLIAAKTLGFTTVPCHIISNISAAESKAIKAILKSSSYTQQSESPISNPSQNTDSIHEEKFKVISSFQSSMPDYLL